VGFPDDLGRVDPHVQLRHRKFRDPADLRT
jgi:hypothetical protein